MLPVFLLFATTPVLATVAQLPFSSCFDGVAPAKQLSIETVYGQVVGQPGDYYLNLTVVGSSTTGISGYSNDSSAGSSLSTLFTTTDVLTLNVNESATYFCSTLNPSPLYTMNTAPNADASKQPRYCPLPAGPFAFSSTVPYGETRRSLTTLSTRLKALDPFNDELFCIDVLTTTVEASLAGQDGQSGEANGHYGQAIYIFYVSIALAICYFILTSVARVTTAWGRGLYHSSSSGPRRTGTVVWTRVQSAGYIVASAISGERLGTSPSLLRFCTPSAKDIVLHTQFCAILVMIRVQWADFVYPLLIQASWATLAYNITLTQDTPHHYNPTSPDISLVYPSTFSSQFNDSTQPIYIDPNTPNVLMVYPHNHTSDGIEKFAFTLGVRPQDLFPVALVVFLGCVAATVAVALLFWFIDSVGTALWGTSSGGGGGGRTRRDSAAFRSGTRSPAPFATHPGGSKEGLDAPMSPVVGSSLDGGGGAGLFRPSSKFGLERSSTPGLSRGLGGGGIRGFRRFFHRSSGAGMASFHLSVLHGNLVRLLALFHLPITIFSSYQMALPAYKSDAGEWDVAASVVSKGLAGFSYAVFAIILPVFLMARIVRTPTNKLFSETRTLLMLGPLYNVYSQGSQNFALMFFVLNIIFGTFLGASQGTTPSTADMTSPSGAYGLAQGILLLVCEIAGALVTSIWLPWGFGAGMGLWSFLSCVGRVVVAVMVIILSNTVNIGAGPGAWVTYGVLVIIAMHYLAFTLGLLAKILEAITRLVTRQPFRNASTSLDAGLLGVCCAGRRRRKGRKRKTAGGSSGNKKTHHRYTKTSETLTSNQGSGQFLPPQTFRSQGGSSSVHSGPPLSVLRPEQANKDYDSEDDMRQELSGGGGGFIMGAWKPSGDGYEPLSNPNPDAGFASSSPTEQKKSGFTRVAGGKAKMENPYAALPSASGSQHIPTSGAGLPVPSTSGIGTMSSVPPSSYPSSSVAAAAAGPSSSSATGLPPGAAAPSHVRTKSQTAIVEHFAPHIPQPTSNLAAYSTPVFSSDDSDEEDEMGPKRKWNIFGGGRKKRASTSEIPNPPPVTGAGGSGGLGVDLEMGGGRGQSQSFSHGDQRPGTSEGVSSPDAAPAAPVRSFVVVRKGQRPGTSGSGSTGGR
ncbi:hypothetical protein DL96DRAFT_1579684 [Flagelloscypha sp. PMI_526]|nr:hypothetical protein DL96DRAFT_1579684 [Flagelloscypha sp. PMI_526]